MSIDLKKKGAYRKKIKGEKKTRDIKMDLIFEFRFNNSIKASGHPAIIFHQEGRHFYCFGITHNKRTRGADNIPLYKNPDPNDKRQAYIRKVYMIEHKSKLIHRGLEVE